MPLNEAFRGILNEPLFPTIGLRTPGEVIEANFGQKPFLFDFLAEAKVIHVWILNLHCRPVIDRIVCM